MQGYVMLVLVEWHNILRNRTTVLWEKWFTTRLLVPLTFLLRKLDTMKLHSSFLVLNRSTEGPHSITLLIETSFFTESIMHSYSYIFTYITYLTHT